jgi:hypothetical protein
MKLLYIKQNQKSSTTGQIGLQIFGVDDRIEVLRLLGCGE